MAKGDFSLAFGQNNRAVGQNSGAFGYGSAPAPSTDGAPTNDELDAGSHKGIAKSDNSLAGMGGSTYENSGYSLA